MIELIFEFFSEQKSPQRGILSPQRLPIGNFRRPILRKSFMTFQVKIFGNLFRYNKQSKLDHEMQKMETDASTVRDVSQWK
jgi:hypothetical protein